MNISYNWLKDIIELSGTADEVAGQLTRVGLAVEGIHPHGEDLVFDIDLTSNRPDCLSHLGIARELSVYTGKPVKSSNRAVPDVPMPGVLAGDIVKIEAPDICHRFTRRSANARSITSRISPTTLCTISASPCTLSTWTSSRADGSLCDGHRPAKRSRRWTKSSDNWTIRC